MGASKKIQDTNLNITQFKCSNCCQPFTHTDKETDNWELYWDTSNDVKIDEIWPNNNGFTLCIWVRSIIHKEFECPETERCRGCYNRFLTAIMTQQKDDYYCSPCYK